MDWDWDTTGPMDWDPDDHEMTNADDEMDWDLVDDDDDEMDWDWDSAGPMEIVDDDVEMEDPMDEMDWDWDTTGPMDWDPDDHEMTEADADKMDWDLADGDVEMCQ